MKALRQLSATFLFLGVACANSDSVGTTGIVSRPLSSLSGPLSQVCASAANTTGNVGVFDITPNPDYRSIIGAGWIGPFANSGVDYVPVGSYEFTTNFEAPKGGEMTGTILADNGATILVNGIEIAKIGATTSADLAVAATFQVPTTFSAPAGSVVEGTNVLKVILYNAGFGPGETQNNPTGASYCISIGKCRNAVALANDYLRSLGISTSSPRGKSIISVIAQEMGPGAQFATLTACEAGYGSAVRARVDELNR